MGVIFIARDCLCVRHVCTLVCQLELMLAHVYECLYIACTSVCTVFVLVCLHVF